MQLVHDILWGIIKFHSLMSDSVSCTDVTVKTLTYSKEEYHHLQSQLHQTQEIGPSINCSNISCPNKSMHLSLIIISSTTSTVSSHEILGLLIVMY